MRTMSLLTVCFFAALGVAHSQTVDKGCLLKHCSGKSLACAADSMCRQSLSCSKKCMDESKKQPKDSYIFQNCSLKCAYSYDNDKYDAVTECMADNGCLQFPPVTKKCKTNIVPMKPKEKLNQKVLLDTEGWWAVFGVHPIYDCFPCQHTWLIDSNTTMWNWHLKMEVWLADETTKQIDETWDLPKASAAPNEFDFVHHDLGLHHKEHWYVLDAADNGDWVIIYYCGSTLNWSYDGGIVFAKNPTVTAEQRKTIANSYKQSVGIDLNDTCMPRTGDQCHD